ncbi:MAG: repair protein SbcC/Rad50 [Solirubrobacteraceae bacterium]|nr:repair protein SbcC/Rad50 [Solirubrobacteraceae bacterium]
MTKTRRVLAHLSGAGFAVREGGVAPFGELLPLVTGVAWDRGTAQVAFVAESEGEPDADAWRQLLFAASGLRHHLSERPSAFGTPLVVAVVDEVASRALRRLVEELRTTYALFNRVDLNLVPDDVLIDDDALDIALAPLLPCCRRVGDKTISRSDVHRFWRVLRDNIREAAQDLPASFGDFRELAADELADALIGSREEEDELPAPSAVRSLSLTNFRSFAEWNMEFEHVTVVHGANGSGKSSILEALELLWSGTTQRRPPEVSAREYQRHLPRGGDGDFVIRGQRDDSKGLISVTSVSEAPQSDLRRSVLAQETVAALVDCSPGERYVQLLAVTGLQIPELGPRTKRLVDNAKMVADAALSEAGLPHLRAINSDGLKHLRGALKGGFAARMPGDGSLADAERAVGHAVRAAYKPREWIGSEEALDALIRADSLLDTVSVRLDDSTVLVEALDDAAHALRRLADPRREAARTLRVLVDAIAARGHVARDVRPTRIAPLSSALAARWLSHADGVRESAARFRSEASALNDMSWAQRLTDYADALDAAAAVVPRTELADLTSSSPALDLPPVTAVPAERYYAAGFRGVPAEADEIVPLLQDLQTQLQRDADALDNLASEIERHPAREFGSRADRIVGAICRFELARQLRREGPIVRASEELLKDLLEGRLYPIVRELVAAIVRFEWYFEPLRLTVKDGRVLMSGLATSHSDLDARLQLNSAERTVVGLAWFLALHLLQPDARRRVLVLDDPAGAFDAINRAGYAATLRAFLRLARPEQVVVATHDDAVATLLADELSPVAGWPSVVTRIHCQRDEDDKSVTSIQWRSDGSGDLAEEEAMLGLRGEASLFAT